MSTPGTTNSRSLNLNKRSVKGNEPGAIKSEKLGQRAIRYDFVQNTYDFGPWQLAEEVAQSRWTRVFRGRSADVAPDGPANYMIKVARQERDISDWAQKLLATEAWVGKTVAHRHLIPVIAGRTSTSPYYTVTPWLEGTTLKVLTDHRHASLRLPFSRILWLVRQVCEALDALYQAGWTHGDVKPENIHLSPTGHVTLLDLCYARRLDAKIKVSDCPVFGTLNYAAPELLSTPSYHDARSDVYSLGVVLYELIVGRKPFVCNDTHQLIRLHREHLAPDPRRFNPSIPDAIVRLLRMMLAKDPLRRPQSPADMIESLSRLEIETIDLDLLPIA